MHSPIVVELPDLSSISYCLCGYKGELRSGDKSTQNAVVDSLAHLESCLKDQWAREASMKIKVKQCPLCHTALKSDEEFPDYAECDYHYFLIKENSKGTLLVLENDFSNADQLVIDTSWNNRCPVVNCPGYIQHHTASYGNSDLTCSTGHEFKTHTIAPFIYCELI